MKPKNRSFTKTRTSKSKTAVKLTRKSFYLKVLTVLSLSFFLFPDMLHSQEIPVDIVDRVNAVEFIFEGTVINSEAYYTNDGAYIHTSNTVEITKILKGRISCGTIEIITQGGQIDDDALKLSHSLELSEGSTGIFLCDETDKPLSVIDYYPETNPEKLEATFENQSFIRYWWDGQGYNAADLWQNYDSLAQVYNVMEVITGYNFVDCESGKTNKFLEKLGKPADNFSDIEESFPHYSKSKFDSLMNYAKFKKENFTEIKVGKTNSDKVFYSLENIIVTGTVQKYIEFDVMIKDNLGTKYLDQSAIRLEYDPATFGNNIVANNNILVTRGTLNSNSACYSDPTPQDMNPYTVLIPALETVYSQCKAPILTNPQSIMHIKMKIQDCSVPSDIQLVDTVTFFTPSLILDYSAYADFPNDTFQTYYTDLEHNQLASVPHCKATITDFYPKSVAGGIGNILSIYGYQFGATRGTGNVYFLNADDGGNSQIYLDNIDYILWSDTLIQIKVPSYNSALIGGSTATEQTAGTGYFRVIANDGTSDYSPQAITIRFSHYNTNAKKPIF